MNKNIKLAGIIVIGCLVYVFATTYTTYIISKMVAENKEIKEAEKIICVKEQNTLPTAKVDIFETPTPDNETPTYQILITVDGENSTFSTFVDKTELVMIKNDLNILLKNEK